MQPDSLNTSYIESVKMTPRLKVEEQKPPEPEPAPAPTTTTNTSGVKRKISSGYITAIH